MEYYTAAGNSFIIFNNLDLKIKEEDKSSLVLENIKERDGAIFVEKKDKLFFMDYFNRDGKRAEFCGNGARAFIKFLFDNKLIKKEKIEFNSYAGIVQGEVISENTIKIRMPKYKYKGAFFDKFNYDLIIVGVPHCIIKVDDIEKIDVNNEGKMMRKLTGANINFYEIINKNTLKIRTFEKGVERETLACGSGATATAIIYNKDKKLHEINIIARGGNLKIIFSNNNIYLQGGAINV